mgnify:CR=1 FL=1|jgi:PA domain.
MRIILFTCCLLINYLSGHAQNTDSLLIRVIADDILMHGKAYAHLRVLTKQIGNRLSGSSQTYLAEAWAQKALREAGAGQVRLQPCLVPHWVRGGKDEAWVLQGGKKKLPLDVLALGNTVGTGPKGIQAPVLLIHSFEELEQRKNEVKGKIVFYNYRFNERFIKTFEAYRDAVPYRSEGPARAARYGAVAVLVRSMSHAADNHPHTGSTRYIDSIPKIPAAALGLQDADRLASMAANEKVNLYVRTNGRFLRDTVAHNVIGEITGNEFPEQIITVGGHLDS